MVGTHRFGSVRSAAFCYLYLGWLLLASGSGCTVPEGQPAFGDGSTGSYAADGARSVTPDDLWTAGDSDLAQPAGPPGAVGPMGGSVNLLHMGLTGDSRPPSCEDTAHYPSDVVSAIATQFQQKGVDFALDLGDHMYVCNNSLPTAVAQMGLYMAAIKKYAGTWFMTMGNHECYKGPCFPGSTNANYVAFMDALKPLSALPYYSFDIATSKGLMTFVVVADNGWDATQASWLEQTLAKADQAATYTIVARHHPEGDTTVSTNAVSIAIIRKHKFALLLTGHDHLYKHMTTDQGRDLVFGAGGAPLVAGGAFHGYVILDQQPDGNLDLTVYDVATNAIQDSWSVGPNK